MPNVLHVYRSTPPRPTPKGRESQRPATQTAMPLDVAASRRLPVAMHAAFTLPQPALPTGLHAPNPPLRRDAGTNYPVFASRSTRNSMSMP